MEAGACPLSANVEEIWNARETEISDAEGGRTSALISILKKQNYLLELFAGTYMDYIIKFCTKK